MFSIWLDWIACRCHVADEIKKNVNNPTKLHLFRTSISIISQKKDILLNAEYWMKGIRAYGRVWWIKYLHETVSFSFHYIIMCCFISIFFPLIWFDLHLGDFLKNSHSHARPAHHSGEETEKDARRKREWIATQSPARQMYISKV